MEMRIDQPRHQITAAAAQYHGIAKRGPLKTHFPDPVAFHDDMSWSDEFVFKPIEHKDIGEDRDHDSFRCSIRLSAQVRFESTSQTPSFKETATEYSSSACDGSRKPLRTSAKTNSGCRSHAGPQPPPPPLKTRMWVPSAYG